MKWTSQTTKSRLSHQLYHQADSAWVWLMRREMSCLELQDGLLYRRRLCENRPVCQLVLPHGLGSSVLTSLHNEMGHMGIKRTLELVRSRFYWPRMAFDVETKEKRKSQPEKCPSGQYPNQQTHGAVPQSLWVPRILYGLGLWFWVAHH